MTTELDEAPTPQEVESMSLAALRRLAPEDIGRDLTEGEISHIFEATDALWLHSGDSARPHAELTSGKCSDGFVNVLAALRYTNICEIFADQLVRLVAKHHHGLVSWVVGSDHAGAVLSYAVAARLGASQDFTEKSGPDGKSQTWKRFQIGPRETVLQVEELVTTTQTLAAVRKGIRVGTPHQVKFLPFTVTLVHRSDADKFEDDPILYLVHYDIRVWDPKDCPLCAQGSKRLRPKTNWAELTGRAA